MSNFNIKDFVVSDDEKVTVCIPKVPFRAKREVPGNSKKKEYSYIIFRSGKWWIVHPDIAESGLVKNIYKACLIEAVDQSGRYLMIPVTYPFDGGPTSWFESWKSAISTALDKWVTVTSDPANKVWVPKVAKDKSEPEWPYYTHGEWLERAFHGRVITSLDHPALAENRRRRYEDDLIIEEDM